MSVRLSFLLLFSIEFISSCAPRTQKQEEPISLDQSIWAVYQDSRGNYWFGSNGSGVYRFDGTELIQYTISKGLADNSIRGIQEDSQGNILIETPSGVSRYDGEIFTTLPVDRSARDDWQLGPDDLWFSCNAKALDVYRYDGSVLHELKLPEVLLLDSMGVDPLYINYNPYSVFGIDTDTDGNVWFGTVVAGAFRFDGDKFLWIGARELSRQPDGREPGVRTMVQDKNGYFWLSQFANKYSVSNTSFTRSSNDQLLKFFEEDDNLFFNTGISDKEGNLWMAAFTAGVWKYNGQEWSPVEINSSLDDLEVITIYEDKQGEIWLGTNNDGVYLFSDESFHKFTTN